MGPEIISVWCDCSYIFGEITAWSEPCVDDWEKDKMFFDPEHPLYQLTVRFIELLIERSRGAFIPGIIEECRELEMKVF